MAAAAGGMALLVAALCWRPLMQRAGTLFLAPGSVFSLPSLLVAAIIGATAITLHRRARGRRTSLALLWRAVLRARLARNRSVRADLGFLALNTVVTGTMIGWAILSFARVEHAATLGLTAAFGPAPNPPLAPLVTALVLTVFLFLAYELAYWLDHYTSHHIAFFWEFHSVHHAAETLTPFTVWRVHPIESLKFANMTALVMAPASALAHYALGTQSAGWAIGGTNVILLAGVCLVGHLQHSHVWIPVTGRLGAVLASPAHHQLHHSADPDHFGHNLGSMLTIFDWLFGTLLIPTRQRPRLNFGVQSASAEPHGITATLITPFTRAFATLPRRKPVQTLQPAPTLSPS